MKKPYGFRRIWWECSTVISLVILFVPALAQAPRTSDVPAPAKSSFEKRPALKTERQKWTALRNAKRLSDQAEVYEKQGDASKAEQSAEEALALEEQVRGPWHLAVAQSLDQLADLYRVHQKESSAEPLYERARAIRERALSVHPDIYEKDNGQLRVQRNQPAEKAGPKEGSGKVR